MDAESAARAKGHRGAGEEVGGELAMTMTAGEIAEQAAEAIRALNELASASADFVGPDQVREVITSLERMGQDLPQLCEKLARILVVQQEDGHIATGSGRDPDFWVIEVVEALAAAGRAADMMTAALNQAGRTSEQLEAFR